MSRSDSTQPPKFGGRAAFAQGKRVRSGPDPDLLTDKGHPRESWREDREAQWRKARRADRQHLDDEGPPPEHRQDDVHWDRW